MKLDEFTLLSFLKHKAFVAYPSFGLFLYRSKEGIRFYFELLNLFK